jgi:protein involved in polysaccharide export with SLBB domain
VNIPGHILIPASGKFDLASAIATAGGLAPTADPGSISLLRASGETSRHTFAGIQKGGVVKVGAGDRIIVGESRYLNQTVVFVGEVRTAGPIPFPLDGNLDIVMAVARAGGFTDLANPRKVSVNRGGVVTVHDVKDMASRGNNAFRLESNDIVTVPERWF